MRFVDFADFLQLDLYLILASQFFFCVSRIIASRQNLAISVPISTPSVCRCLVVYVDNGADPLARTRLVLNDSETLISSQE